MEYISIIRRSGWIRNNISYTFLYDLISNKTGSAMLCLDSKAATQIAKAHVRSRNVPNNDVTILYNAPGANLKRYAARAIPELSILKKNT